jgi:hypothetical protein
VPGHNAPISPQIPWPARPDDTRVQPTTPDTWQTPSPVKCKASGPAPPEHRQTAGTQVAPANIDNKKEAESDASRPIPPLELATNPAGHRARALQSEPFPAGFIDGFRRSTVTTWPPSFPAESRLHCRTA